MTWVTRFAPSPTGLMHLGHALAAKTASERGAGGRFLLRIEDIDPVRCRAEYTAAILEDMRWLDLRWDGAVRMQSEHLDAYAAVLRALRRRHLLYPCFCTRADIAASGHAPHRPDGALVYPGTCRHRSDAADRLARGDRHAWRLDMAAAVAITGALTWHEDGQGALACDPLPFGDVVLGRKDAPCSYHLCVTHDDAHQGVTLVTRGEDLRPATAVHRVLQALMGWPEPAYAHHPLLRDAAGRRLSKRDGAPTLQGLRARGLTPEAVWRLITPDA